MNSHSLLALITCIMMVYLFVVAFTSEHSSANMYRNLIEWLLNHIANAFSGGLYISSLNGWGCSIWGAVTWPRSKSKLCSLAFWFTPARHK